jgi:hypothetical protein
VREDRGVGVLIQPVPARRRPVQLGLAADRIDTVDGAGQHRWWPRSAVTRLRLISVGVTGTDPAGIRVPLATALAVDGVAGAVLVRLPWWGTAHEGLEQGAARAEIPLVYAEGRALTGGQPTLHRPQWRVPTAVALLLGPAEVAVTDRNGRQVVWPRVGHPPPTGGHLPPAGGHPPPAGGYPPPTGGHPAPAGSRPPPTSGHPAPAGENRAHAAAGGFVPPVARLRLYRDYNTGSWLKAVSLVDPWRRELALLRWDTLRGAGPMHDAACAAGLMPEFCWESALPDQVGQRRVPLVV